MGGRRLSVVAILGVMSAPVQTWGSLGSMVAEQREFGVDTAKYLEANEVYDYFGELLRQIIVHQPEDPIKFLQEFIKGQQPLPLTVAVIGPPGIKRSDNYCKKIAESFGIENIHVGSLLTKAANARKDSAML